MGDTDCFCNWEKPPGIARGWREKFDDPAAAEIFAPRWSRISLDHFLPYWRKNNRGYGAWDWAAPQIGGGNGASYYFFFAKLPGPRSRGPLVKIR